MRKYPLSVGCVLYLLCCSVILSVSAEDNRLQEETLKFIVEKEEDGREIFIEANEKKIEPGMIVEYRLIYRNVSDSSLTGIDATGAVPRNAVYVGGSASSDERLKPEFSVDRGHTFHSEPVRYQREVPGGAWEWWTAFPVDYTHVRWRVERLEPEETVELRYRVNIRR